MDRVVLACVDGNMPIVEAIGHIALNTNAIVVRAGDQARVLLAKDLFDALNDALDRAADPKTITAWSVKSSVTKGDSHTPKIRQAGRIGNPGKILGMHGLDRSMFEAAVSPEPEDNGKEKDYVVEELGTDTASIVTSRESIARDFARRITICRCEGDPVHSFEQNQIRKKWYCNKPHRKRVTCGQASNT